MCRALSEREERVVYSISCTTRAPREGEVDGEDYFFLEEEAFRAAVERGEFLEWAVVHGNYYGTRAGWVREQLEAGRDVVMDLDVQGAASVRAADDAFIRERRVDVFVMPKAMEELRGRLSGRRTESEAQMALRLQNALEEMQRAGEYEHQILSGTKEADLAAFAAIVERERGLKG